MWQYCMALNADGARPLGAMVVRYMDPAAGGQAAAAREAQLRRGHSLSSSQVAITCGVAALVIALLLAGTLWCTERCCCRMALGWRRRRQGSAPAVGPASAAEGSRTNSSTASGGNAHGASSDKQSASGGAQAQHLKLVAVLVMQPDDTALVGTTHVLSDAPAEPLNPTGRRSSDSIASNSSSSSSSRRVSSEVQRAAYLAELEEREASRREAARRSGGLAGSSGGWGLSFLPIII